MTTAHGGSPHWARWIFSKGSAAHGEPMMEQVYTVRLQPTVGRTHISRLSVRRNEEEL